MRLLSTFLLLVGLALSSCSVQVREAKTKSLPSDVKKTNRTYNQQVAVKTTQQQIINREPVIQKTDINGSEEIKSLIDYQLSKEDKEFLIRESKILSIPIPEDSDIEYFINYYTTTKKYFTENAFRRANYFLPMVRRVFRDEGLPEELAYLGIVESGFNPFATSPSNAAGIWQFIPSTGKRFGLTIDEYVDERRDPYKSTVAAAKYLKFLYNMFGSWELAIAGYNCGEKCVQKRADATGSYKFSDIKYALPKETMEYVPRFFAILLIAQNPQKYGLDINFNTYDMTTTQADRDVSIEEYAQFVGVDLDILRFYNAHFKKGLIITGYNVYTPRLDMAFDKRFIYLPPQKPTSVADRNSNERTTTKPEPKKDHRDDNFILAILKSDTKPEIVKTTYKREKFYKVEKGDTLYSIARRFGVDVETLRKINNLQDDTIREGDVLLLE